MKTRIVCLGLLAAAAAFAAPAPMRVALLDFENEAAPVAASDTVGGVGPAAVAGKGVLALGALLANEPEYTLIDRRDFLAQIQASGGGAAPRPSFLRAAQALNADVVLRGVLLSFAPGRERVDQGGLATEFQTLTLRVALQALDTSDGAVIAVEEGAATRRFRQSAAHQTVAGEDEVLQLLQTALGQAAPGLKARLRERTERLAGRRKVKLSVKAGSADPALVEIDGVLVGSTPLDGFQVYAGDHVITIGKAGYRDVSKRILVESDTAIEAPLFRAELSAEEMKAVLDKARINIVAGSGGLEPAWIIQTIESPAP